MGKYKSVADEVVKRAIERTREKTEREQARIENANAVVNLQEWADDINAALKKDKFFGEVKAIPWKVEGEEMAGGLEVSGNKSGTVRIVIGKHIQVNDKRCSGIGLTDIIGQEVLTILAPPLAPE